jgi:hypothetical protein
MADRPSFFSRALDFLALPALPNLSPAEAGSPEDDGSAPEVGVRYSRTAEEVLGLNGPFFAGLKVNDDEILRREGAQDLKLFDRLLDDDVAMSTLQQRRLAITSRDWEVTPGDDTDPRSVMAADDFRAMLDALAFDDKTGKLHYAVWYGYAVGEAIWSVKERDGRLIYWLDDIVVPDRKLFGFGFDGSLRFHAGLATFGGDPVPANKFIAVRTGGTHDFAFYGLGLAHWVYWPVWFKKAATRFWALYLEKLASPTAVGGFAETASEKEKNDLVAALVSIGRDSAVIVPEGYADKIKFMEATRGGVSGSTYREFKLDQDEAIMRIVLGQPGTTKATPGGIGSTQADVHADVKAELVKADSDLISDALNNTVAKWVTRWNHGDDVAPPKVFRVLDDAEDQTEIAERDAKLDALGWQRTDDSFKQVYGDGYERKPTPVVPPALATPGRPPIPADVDPETGDLKPESVFSAAEEDEIDRLTSALVDEADPFLSAFAASIQGAIAKVKADNGGERPTIEQVRVAMLTAFESFDPAALAKATGLSFLAERAAASAGAEDDLQA